VETRLLIAGELVAGEGGPIEVENPFTEQRFARVAQPSAEQVDAAIARAAESARRWAATPAVGRAD
jgi:aminobutyraldehyde dehydrogenase